MKKETIRDVLIIFVFAFILLAVVLKQLNVIL